MKHKVISRSVAYHGTPQGALSITGIPAAKEMFEPLVPGGLKVPNTNIYRAPEHLRDDPKTFGAVGGRPDRRGHRVRGPGHRRRRLPRAGAELRRLLPAAARVLRPGPGDLRPLRRPPRRGRDDLRVRPDRRDVRLRGPAHPARHDHLRQGHDERLLPHRRDDRERPGLRALPARDDVLPARLHLRRPPGVGRGRDGQPRHLRARGPVHRTSATQGPVFRATLEKLLDLPIVGDVRGEGFFYGIELVKDKATRETFDDDESERLLRGFLSKALFDAGLYCRADDRGDPVIQLAPPVIIGQREFDDIESILRSVLTEAWNRL